MKLETVLSLCLLILATHASVSKFVLLHGAWQNSAPYEGTIEGLEELGYDVEAINLPANFADATDAQRGSVTYDDYIEAMDDLFDDINEKVILVCHSRFL